MSQSNHTESSLFFITFHSPYDALTFFLCIKGPFNIHGM